MAQGEVGPADLSPHRHTPCPVPLLYYQIDDGSGNPPQILMTADRPDAVLFYF